MCTPGLALMGAGFALSAYGNIQQGKYLQAQGAANQGIAEFAAVDALDRGERDAAFQTLKTASFKSDQRVTQGKSGVRVGTGSAADVTDTTELMGNLDAMTIRENARREAYQYRTSGIQARTRGDVAGSQGRINAFSTLLTGGGQIASNYRISKKVGVIS